MGKRHSIVAKKTAGDANKAKVYANMSKVIQLAAKKGSDPKMNPSLELALQKARYNSVPRDIIDRAILKGSGQGGGSGSEIIEEVFYEGYGPGGSAVVVKATTNNKNRTQTNIKIIFQKGRGNIATMGSVIWQFDEIGEIIIDGLTNIENIKGKQVENTLSFDQNTLEDYLLENIEFKDLEFEDGICMLITNKEDFGQILQKIESDGYHIRSADLQFYPKNTVTLDDENTTKLDNLIESLENDEDVDSVRTS